MDTTPLDFVKVKTTLPTIPLPLHASRQHIVTERLILRPISLDDLQALHTLRTQPEVMKWSAIGRIDTDLDETQKKLAQDLPPNDASNYNFSICLRSTGQWIGHGGCKTATGGELGWPEIGYLFQKEFWGKGYATEFMQAFLSAWWSLPRSEIEISVEKASVRGLDSLQEGEVVKEKLTAVVASDNPASLRILEKCGFEKFKMWKDKNPHDQTELILIGNSVNRPTQ